MGDVRVKIDVRLGIFELEGDREFVGPYFDKLLPLIQTLDVKTEPLVRSEENSESTGISEGGQAEPPATKKRRKAAKPPPGGSCRERILTLKSDGFFKSHRTNSDILGGLANKGWTHNLNQIGAALTNMFEKGEIQRTKSVGGNFTYFWDRD